MLPRSLGAKNTRVRWGRCVVQTRRGVSGGVHEGGWGEMGSKKRRTMRMVGGGERAESTCLRKNQRILQSVDDEEGA